MTVVPPHEEFLTSELTDFFEAAVDQDHGLLTRLEESANARKRVGIYIVKADLASPTYFRGNAPSVVRTISGGTGAGVKRDAAYWSAIGEAIERYCASIYREDDLISACGAELPHTDILFDLIQSPRAEVHSYSKQMSRRWVKAKMLCTDDACFLPASIVYLGYKSQIKTETIAQSDSSGLACGRTQEAAERGAILELLERDAFVSSWQLMRRPPEIMFSRASLPKCVAGLEGLNPYSHLDIRYFYIANNAGAHVVAGFLSDGDQYCSIGASANPVLALALEKAGVEAMQGWWAAGQCVRQKTPMSLSDLNEPFDHLRYYMCKGRIETLENYFAGHDTIDFKEIEREDWAEVDARALAGRLNAEGIKAMSARLTTRDIEALGLEVVRVVAPGLQPMTFGPSSPNVIDDRRLQHWQRTWNLQVTQFNSEPHPFP